MRRKSKRKKLCKKLDDLCRQLVRLIYENRCCRCSQHIEGQNSHPCHIIAKGNGASWRRFDLLNLFLGCFKCHRWWHDNPIESGKWFAGKWPERHKYLIEKYGGGKPCEISTEEMEKLVVDYKQKYEELCNEKNGVV